MDSLKSLAFYAATTPDSRSGFSVLQCACVGGDHETVRNIILFSPSQLDVLIALSIPVENAVSQYSEKTLKEIVALVSHPSRTSIKNIFAKSAAGTDGLSLMHMAARVGNASHIRRLAALGADTTERNAGSPPLHIAAGFNTQEVIKELVSQGAPLWTFDNIHDKAPHLSLSTAQVAAWRGKTENLLLLLDKGRETFSQEKSYSCWLKGCCNSCLHLAVWGGHKDTVSCLIERGYDINERCSRGFPSSVAGTISEDWFKNSSPLMLSALAGNLEMFLFLIERGANILYQRHDLKNVLTFAVKGGNLELVEIVLSKTNLNLSIKDSSGATLLQHAGGKEIARMLIEKGLDVNTQDGTGKYTPLRNAVEQGDLKLAKLLVASGALISQCDSEGNTLLSSADKFAPGSRACEDTFQTTRYLIEQGANVNAANAYGRTTLHNAGKLRATGKIVLLLEAGANINATDVRGRTALHYACDPDPELVIGQDDPSTAIVLLEGGINHTLEYSDAYCPVGRKAVNLAVSNQLFETMEVLKAA